MITYPYDHYFSEDSVQTDIVITDGTASYSGTSLVVTGNTVLFTNENIDSEKMSLLETLCSDNTLRWGRCEASELKFTIHSSVVPLEGTVLNVYLYFDNDASTLFKIGTYKVDSDVATALRTVREITCYDALLDVLNAEYIDWYNALDFNTVNTIKKFRDAFFTHVGITQKTISLINDSVAVSKLSTESLTGSQILNAICEINGRFGHIDRDGKFAYIKLDQNIQGLYPAVDLYPSPTLYPRQPKSTPIASGSYIPPLKYEKYEVPSITRLQIRTDDSDIGVVVGTAGTDYVIQGNFLTFNLTGVVLTGIANNILGEISGVVYQPFEVQMRANLCFEVGDAIRCNDDLTGVEGYILYRNAVGIQAIIDTLNCMKERDYKLDANSVGYQFNAVNNRTASIRTDVDEVSATLTYQLDPTQAGGGGQQASYAYQTAEAIGSKVSQTDYNGNEIASLINQTATTIQIEASKIKLEGYVSINGGFEIDNSGNAIMADAELTNTINYGNDKIELKIDGDSLGISRYLNGSPVSDGDLILSWATTQHIDDYADAKIGVGGISYEVWNGSTFNTVFDVNDDEEITLLGAVLTKDSNSKIKLDYNNIFEINADAYIGIDTSKSGNLVYLGHESGTGYTGSFVNIKGYQIRLDATSVLVNGNPIPTSSGISIGDVDSHYGTSVSGNYITWNLSAFNRLQFYSAHSLQTFTLNDILRACGLVS